MHIDVKSDCSGVDWNAVSTTLKRVGMASFAPDLHEKAFKNSHTTIFLYHEKQLIGFGRAISDGVYQAAVYDLAVAPEFQKKGLGKRILQHIMDRLPECTVILYASPGKEDFYCKQGFRKMKTGMARFRNAKQMAEKGFIE